MTHSPQRRRSHLGLALRFLAPAAVALGLVFSHGVRAGPAAAEVKPAVEEKAPPAAVAPAVAPVPGATGGPPLKVEVGLYLLNIPDIDLKTNSFSAEFYLWLLWAGELDPTLTFGFANLVSPSELVKTPVFVDPSGAPAPELLPDGRHLQQFHVYGRFARSFHMERYPFDNHFISITIEDNRSSAEHVQYVIDAKGTGERLGMSVPGWFLSPIKATESKTYFTTTFGDPRSGRSGEAYSHLEFGMRLERPLMGIIPKTIIPIALIILITFGAFFLKAADIEARLSLTVTALISAVALQLTAASELPPTGSLLLLDKIYLLSYVAILAVTFFSIGVYRLGDGGRADAAARLDRLGLWAVGGGYFLTLLLLVLVS